MPMVLYRDLNLITQPFSRPVITIGNFDGVHLGHQTLFGLVRERAAAVNGHSVVITFDPHPIKLMQPGRQLPLLTTTDQKIRLLGELNLDIVIVHPFTKEFGAMPAREFIQHYLLERLGVQEIVIGHDYRFGHNREGNIALLQTLGAAWGFPVHVVDAIQVDEIIVSSTLIRNLIRDGKVAAARTFLGRSYEVTGEVIHGHGRGARLLGFPTANIRADNELLPVAGIYAVRATLWGRTYAAVANIGVCPTFDNDELSLEVHILDFNQDIYGSHLAVEFVQRLRDERRFPNIPALVDQIKTDVEAARQIVRLEGRDRHEVEVSRQNTS
ncbi:bifunctional riboflavin kinase/FAD synthetase [Desulfobacca acetoxidans]|nr:bifunctional riboflavin kinase/FAD synthetase [Desulfobacca acetoxidans]